MSDKWKNSKKLRDLFKSFWIILYGGVKPDEMEKFFQGKVFKENNSELVWKSLDFCLKLDVKYKVFSTSY